MTLSSLYITLLALLGSVLSGHVMALDFEESNKIIGEALIDCSPTSVEFEHPFTGEMMAKSVQGISDGKCVYSEAIPGGIQLTCHYPAQYQQVIAQFLIDFSQLKPGQYVINGKKTDNPLNVAMSNNICTLSDS